MLSLAILAWLLPQALAQGGLVVNPKNADDGGSGISSIPIDLSGLVNNRGFAMSPETPTLMGYILVIRLSICLRRTLLTVE